MEIGHTESFDIRTQSMNLLSIVGCKYNELQKLRYELGTELLILYTIFIYDGEGPIISLGKEIIDFADKIGACIDFDLYNF